MFQPIARFCMRHGIKIQEALEVFKKCLITAAEEDLVKNQQKITDSKLSIMTGIHRRDITRLYHNEDEKTEQITLLGKVIGTWQLSKRYQDSKGRARCLSCSGTESEFYKLVSHISNDVKPSTVLFELQRSGLAKVDNDEITLISEAYLPKASFESNFQMLSADMQDLIAAVDSNTFDSPKEKNLHAKTEFDNIDVSELPKIRRWLLDKGAEFHKQARDFLAKHDLDLNPDRVKTNNRKGRVVFGTFSLASEDSKTINEHSK